MKILHFYVYIICIALYCPISHVECLKFSTGSLSELAMITKEGERLWDSLREKVNLPQYGLCWKKAVHDLQIGCKYLSEDIQSQLALRFTDCFLQSSGFEPLQCKNARDVCLRNLSDRAFNAYTEFYTHTQSICYFLQSQVWHEEAQKTIEKLSDTSILVSEQLEEAGHMQKNILNQQKESLLLQHHLLDNGKTIASSLESSEEKISKIMADFKSSATEHKKVLFELFEKLTLLRSWVVGEMSWINSVLFYMASMIIGYLFTSISSTKNARIYILILLTINYFIERFIYSHVYDEVYYSGEILNSWIWLSRRAFIIISSIIIIYSALVHCDYNIVNHRLLIEIKNQNKKILNLFESDPVHYNKVFNENVRNEYMVPQIRNHSFGSFHSNRSFDSSPLSRHCTLSPDVGKNNEKHARILQQSIDNLDSVSVTTENSGKSETSVMSYKRETPYNLRSKQRR